jgi:hypothetical protein
LVGVPKYLERELWVVFEGLALGSEEETAPSFPRLFIFHFYLLPYFNYIVLKQPNESRIPQLFQISGLFIPSHFLRYAGEFVC